jgi:protein TonB
MQEGHLIEPEGDSARFYVGEALRSDPEGNATKAAQQTLAHALLADARGAIDRPDFARAASLLEAAVGIAADPDLQSARQLLSAARKQTDADAAHAGLDEAATVGLSSADSSAAMREVEAASNQSGAANPPEAANRPVTANAQPAVANVVGADQLTLVKSVKPIYPTGAERAKTEGWVELDFTVAEGGEVEGISVRAASPAGVFDNAAIAALSQWRYKPVMDEGKPIAQHSRIRIRFTLTG